MKRVRTSWQLGPRLAIGVAIAAALVAFVVMGGPRLLDWHALAQYRSAWQDWLGSHPFLGALSFFFVYIGVTALSIPGGTALTLVGGSLFGLLAGTVIVSFASVVGATLAMLTARYLLRRVVEARFAPLMEKLNEGIRRDGARYLFGLRLVPVVPFFAINAAMGLTQMPARTFAWVSQIGMLPATIVYVNAGSELGSLQSAGDLVSGRLLMAFAALALVPFAVKAAQRWWDRRALLRPWPRPRTVDYNLVVIGGGSAGLVASYIAAAAKARVALIEHGKMGGDCLNTGCVPSKALIRSAKLMKEARHAEQFGLKGALDADFPALMKRVRRVIERVAPHDSAARYQGLGVEVIRGSAYITGPWTVAIGNRTLTTRRIVVATGAEPILPPIPGLELMEPLTSESVWALATQPRTLLVVGGGAIGCELAQSFARLGSRTILLEAAPRLLAREDADVAQAMHTILNADGVELHVGVDIKRFERVGGQCMVFLGDGSSLPFDRVLVATGRRPRVTGFGLEELALLENGRLAVDHRLQTRLPSILAAGDVIGELQFTHAAGHYAWFASINALFGNVKPWTSDISVFPIVIYTDPEVARVGLTEEEAHRKGVAFEVTTYDLGELDRAIADEANQGFVKILTVPGKDRILGATLVGARAGDMLAEFTLAMKHGLGLNAILRTIHPYPGWTEANKAVAGEWRRAHAPAWALSLSERWLRWQRG
ncbi:MAG: FAD-dependent oxidoreductase [Hyphomicrobiaceae bacterium]